MAKKLSEMKPETKQNVINYKNKYNKDTYDRITILRTKGEKDRLKQLAENQGVSMNEFLNKIIDAYLEMFAY